MSTFLALFVLCASPEAPVDTVVVCPREFRAALAPWLAHRQAQGHRAVVLSNAAAASEIRGEVRRLAGGSPVKYLVLVGDADPAMALDPAVRERSVPTHHAAAVVNRRFGSEPEIATDNWYADLDDDRVPELAVGRLTADSPDELSIMVSKILAYERSDDFGRWRSRLHFVAGVGGFGAVADAILQAAAKTLISQGVPTPYDATMTYASWQSPYCPDPRQFRRVALERLNEGSLFWVYIGHGDQRALDPVRAPGAVYPSLSTRDAGLLACRHGAPIACFLACYTGAFDQQRDCLGEEMLRSAGGPVAVICGSRMTMPYAMTVMGSELLGQCFVDRQPTLGEMLLAAKRRTMQPSAARVAIDSAAKAFSPTGDDLDAERAEHLDLFNLLGDPLLRIAHPGEVNIEVAPLATAGQSLKISGTCPLDGTCTIEIVTRRGRLGFIPPRREPREAGWLDECSETYRRANEPRLASTQVQVAGGRFATELAVPHSAAGGCHVRVFVEGERGCALGAADVRIEAADDQAPAASPR